MNIEEIKTEALSNLCYYDTRNPDGVNYYLSQEEIQEEGYRPHPKPGCSCDNCFYGRSKQAETILMLLEIIVSGSPSN